MNETKLNASLLMVPEDLLPSAWAGHLPFSFWLIEEARPDILVELGTHNGTSFLGFCQGIKVHGTRTKAFAVDTWEGDEHSAHYGEEVYLRLDRVIKAKYAGFAQLMRMLFDDAMPYFSDGSVDLLHIDGLHTYEAVKHDFETWLPKMSRRGVIIFHDTMVRERGFGVWQLWEELRERYPSFEFKHTHGLGVLLVGDEPPPPLVDLCALTGTPGEVVTSNMFEALGQRFSQLNDIARLEAHSANALQHAENYRKMYEDANGSLRQATDSFGVQLEERSRQLDSATRELESAIRQLESASEQIAGLMASLDGVRAEFASQIVDARNQLGLEASPGDAAAPAQAMPAFVEELKARNAQRQILEAAADAEILRLKQSLETSEAGLHAQQSRLEEVQSRHDSELAAIRAGFEADKARALESAEEALEAARRQTEALRSRHGEELSAAGARFDQELEAARASHAAEVSALRAQIRQRDVQAQDLQSRLVLREHEVLRLIGSNSWRITAPVRWVRGRLAAFRHGTVAPKYAEMLQVPGGGNQMPPPAGDVARATEGVSATTAGYLQGLFADAAARRAPEYLGPAEAPPDPPASLRAKAIAFYLPQFHCFPENEAWWGPGFTEWTNVTKAVPQFVGHEQPQLPADLGFYDLRVPDVLHRQVELARRYGIHGFCFHYYWFGGKRLMEQPLELFLAQEDLDFPFCLSWANESWTRRWDGRDEEVLISQQHGPENDLAFIRDLERYLRNPRYIRIDGKPLLVVYRASLLPDAAATLSRWRAYCREAGIGEIFIAMAQFDVENPLQFGFDAALEFPPHKLANGFDLINETLNVVNPDYQGSVVHYKSIVDSAKAWPDKGFPLIRGVFPGWDNEARRPGKGYTFAFSTPARYRDWLEFAVAYAEQHPVAGEKIVMINAWNEWAEGAKLEPDSRYGHAYLQATRQALEANDRQEDGAR